MILRFGELVRGGKRGNGGIASIGNATDNTHLLRKTFTVAPNFAADW